MAVKTKQQARLRRHRRVRAKVTGTTARPRLAVYRSNKTISAQVIDDSAGRTLAAASSQDKSLASLARVDAPAAVGKLVAERAAKAGIATVVFDRGGYLYHGRVKALADAARENGLEFKCPSPQRLTRSGGCKPSRCCVLGRRRAKHCRRPSSLHRLIFARQLHVDVTRRGTSGNAQTGIA